MKIFSIKYIVILLFTIISFSSCQDKWEDHIEVKNPDLQRNLFEVISADSDFSKFTELKSSKNFTLILPTNAAVEEASSTVNFNDTLAVRSFIGYHIINSVYNLNTSTDTVRVRNLRYKYVDFVSGKLNDIVPKQSNIVTQNGVYHIVDKALTPYKNIYDFLIDFDGVTSQTAALLSFDTLTTIGDSISITRNPVFQSNVMRPMVNETQKYTYFILEDDFFDQEYNKLLPFYHTSYTADGHRPDSTSDFFTKMNLLRDLIVPGDYSIANMPDTLVSLSGFQFKLDQSQIISAHKVSNGTVYYVRSLPYELKNQIREFKVLGASPSGFSQADKRGNTYYRTKIDVDGMPYNDIQVFGHGISEFYISYRNRATNSVSYKVYARAISGLLGDPQNNVGEPYRTSFDQFVQFKNNVTGVFNASVTNSLGVQVNRFTHKVERLNHDEVYLGEFTKAEFGDLNLRLLSAANTSTTTGQNTLILEYLRFEPVLP
jgi:hypothetical protein